MGRELGYRSAPTVTNLRIWKHSLSAPLACRTRARLYLMARLTWALRAASCTPLSTVQEGEKSRPHSPTATTALPRTSSSSLPRAAGVSWWAVLGWQPMARWTLGVVRFASAALGQSWGKQRLVTMCPRQASGTAWPSLGVDSAAASSSETPSTHLARESSRLERLGSPVASLNLLGAGWHHLLECLFMTPGVWTGSTRRGT